MADAVATHIAMPLGVVVRKVPGVTRWAKWNWRPSAVLPGAGPADWTELRREGDAVEYHAATVPLTLWRAETEAYLSNLADRVPSIYVVLREETGSDHPFSVLLATASPYEGQDYADNGEDIVEKVAMPEGLVAWIRDYVDANHVDEPFIKRRRDKKRVDLLQDGIGDARIRQVSDVYRAPRRKLS